MATLKEANKAREEHFEHLRKKHGAHAILVDKVKVKGSKPTFGVIAFYEELPDDLPETLEVKSDGKTTKVPLVAEVTPTAKLE